MRLGWDEGVRGGSEFRDVAGEQPPWGLGSHRRAMLLVGR